MRYDYRTLSQTEKHSQLRTLEASAQGCRYCGNAGAVATLGMRHACLVQGFKPSRHYAHLMSGKCRSLTIKETLLTYRGHWETLITMVVTQAECRKWTCTHRETHRSTHTDTHTLGSKHHSIGGKNKPLKNKLSVVLYTVHYFCANQGEHILLTALKLFLDFCPYSTHKRSNDYRKDWNVSNLDWTRWQFQNIWQ